MRSEILSPDAAGSSVHLASSWATGDPLRDLSRCVKCGSCRAVCPPFLFTRQESLSPRGRVALIKGVVEGRLPVSKIFEDRLETCTSCLACESACANSVPVTAMIQAARELAVREAGAGPIRKLLATAFRNDRLMKASAWLAPLALHYDRYALMPPRKKQHSSGLFKSGGREKVVFFSGCSIAYYQPGLGDAAITVLEGLGYEVHTPEGFACCGRPLLSLGDRRGAEQAAERNRMLLTATGPAVMVTACASCALTFKKEYPRLLGRGAGMPETLDIHELLAGQLHRLQLAPVPRTVTWHDPCHLGRGLGLGSAARELLTTVPGVTLTEMKDADRCCGFGGVMRVTHPGISDGILEQKVRRIGETRAETVVTGCPSCRTQIADGVRRYGTGTEVLHTIELIARSMRIAGQGRTTKDKGPGKDRT